MRLIDADALQREYMKYHDGKRIVLVDVAPTINPQKWIPVSERLPKDNGDYLVTRNRMGLYSYVDIVTKTNVVDKIASDIKAWMPLPEPWKEEEE